MLPFEFALLVAAVHRGRDFLCGCEVLLAQGQLVRDLTVDSDVSRRDRFAEASGKPRLRSGEANLFILGVPHKMDERVDGFDAMLSGQGENLVVGLAATAGVAGFADGVSASMIAFCHTSVILISGLDWIRMADRRLIFKGRDQGAANLSTPHPTITKKGPYKRVSTEVCGIVVLLYIPIYFPLLSAAFHQSNHTTHRVEL